MAVKNIPKSLHASSISSLEIVNYYSDKPKELMKLFHQIGTKMMASKEHKNGTIYLIYLYK